MSFGMNLFFCTIKNKTLDSHWNAYCFLTGKEIMLLSNIPQHFLAFGYTIIL